MSELQYGGKLSKKKSKEEFFSNTIRDFFTVDDTTLEKLTFKERTTC